MQHHKYGAQMDGLLPGGYDPAAYTGGANKDQDHKGSVVEPARSEPLEAAPVQRASRPGTATSRGPRTAPGLVSQKQYEALLKERIEQVRAGNRELYGPLSTGQPTPGRPEAKGPDLQSQPKFENPRQEASERQLAENVPIQFNNNINLNQSTNKQETAMNNYQEGTSGASVPAMGDQPSQDAAEYERERRLRLRDQERQRRNMNLGDEGLSYGANQSLPPKLIKPSSSLQSQFQEFGGNQGMMQLQIPGQSPQQLHHQPETAGYQPINMSQLAQAQIEKIQQSYNLPEQREPVPLVRRSSKSKLGLEQAKELDNTLNLEANKDAGVGGILRIGGRHQNDQEREMEKRQQQLEYQAFLDRQRAEKEIKGSPNRVKERLNSARRLSTQYENMTAQRPQGNMQEVPRSSPNKGRRNLVRSNSSYGPKGDASLPQNTNILGQPLPPQQPQPAYQRLNTVQHDQKIPLHSRRSGSAARAADYMSDPAQTLIAGGLTQIGDGEQKQIEEKMRKQRAYREYLDMQKNEGRTSVGGGPAAARPPIPGGAQPQTSSLLPGGRPPSGSQQRGRPPLEPNFMASSKSNMDQHYLEEHRRQLSDRVFEELMKKNHGSEAQLPDISQPHLPQPPKREPLRRPGSLNSRQTTDTSGPPGGEQHPFFRHRAEEGAAKQREAEKKKEYALELQNQIAQKKLQHSKQSLPPRAQSQRQALPEAPIEGAAQPLHGERASFHQEQAPTQPNEGAKQPIPVPTQMPQPPHQYLAVDHSRQQPPPPMPYQQQPAYQYELSGAQPPMTRPLSFAPPQGQPTIEREQMEADPLYQQILQQKREEVRRQMELEHAREQAAFQGHSQAGMLPTPAEHQPAPPQFAAGPANAPSSEDREPSQTTEADVQRLRREEYKRELDAQMKEKEQIDGAKVKREVEVQNAFQKPHSGSSVQHALPQVDSRPQGEGPSSRVGVRNRTDITTERGAESEAAQQKKAAYQEELRLQMEQQQKKKEAEKAQQKLEDERFERQLQQQREALGYQEQRELVKEGKIDPKLLDKKELKRVNRQQFETSEQIMERERREKDQQEAVGLDEQTKAAVQQQMKQRMEEELHQVESQPVSASGSAEPSLPTYRPFKLPGSAPDPVPQSQYGYNLPSTPSSMPQPHHQAQPEAPSSSQSQLQEQSFLHQRLLDDQQRMIAMYQQALQQILDFRQDYFVQAQEMQTNLAKERERLMDKAMGPQISTPPQLEIGQQQTEIQQLQAVQGQLQVLMQKVLGQSRSGSTEMTSIINPAVQTNLNDLIKAQRDKVVRMSQDQSFHLRQARAGAGDKYQHRVLINQQEMHEAQDQSRNASFDQSLASQSKLIRVPNQFTNKLQEKAKNFEQQRLLNQSPHGGQQPQFFQNNGSSDYIMPNKSPTNKHDLTGLYSTWNNQPGAAAAQPPQHADASINERVQDGTSPRRVQMMQASLVGSSHLQFMNDAGAAPQPGSIGQTPNQGRAFSPIPHRNQPPGAQDKEAMLSPTSRQMLGNLMGLQQQSRPQTNIVLQQETIPEQPEKEQNLDNTNDYSHDEQQLMARKAALAQHPEGQAIRIQNEHQVPNDRPRNIKYQQSEQVKNKRHELNQQATIETDQDFNNRDESMTKYSQSVHDRKSKVTEIGSKESRTDQIQQNLQFIENQVNLGQQNFQGASSNVLSHSKSPFSNGRHSGQVLSPTSAAQGRMVNIGQLVNQQSGNNPQRAAIPSQTEKSFFRPPTNNLNTSQMANTGMQGAKPTATGSSFYNATMAKTKQQEQNQQEALHEQLMKIFNTGDDETKEEQSSRPSKGREGEGAAMEGDRAGKKNLDDTEYLLNSSNINIAQSVHMSMDMKDGQLQNTIGKVPGTANAAQAVGAGLGTQKGLLGARASAAGSQGPGHLNATNNIIDQQYNWLMQNNVINEQQEYENSKSREDTDTQGINSSVGKSLKVASAKQLSSHHSNAQLSQANEAEDQVESQYGQTAKQSEGIWDNREQDRNGITAKESQLEESEAFQFDGDGTVSSHQQFQVIDVNGHRASTAKSNRHELPPDEVASLPSTSRQKWQVKNSQPSSINQPYTFDPKEGESARESHADDKAAGGGLVHHQSAQYSRQDDHGRPSEPRSQSDYNIAMDQSSARAGAYKGLENQVGAGAQGSPSRNDAITVSKYNIQIGASAGASEAPAYHPAAMKSGISALNLGPGLFSEGEPTSAAILKQDQELNELQKCSPNIGLHQFNTLSDPEEREQHDKLIDQMYEMRNSQQFQFQTQSGAPGQLMPQSQLLAQQKLQRNLDMLSQPSGSPQEENDYNEGLKGTQGEPSLNAVEQSSDIYPSKNIPIYNSNFQEAEKTERNGDAEQDQLARPRERDPILDSTPDVTPQMMQTYGREDLSDVINEQAEMNLTNSSGRTGQVKQVLDTRKLEQMTPSQRNFGIEKKTSESYQLRVEENFEESLQKKYDKIKDIFKIESNEQKGPQTSSGQDAEEAEAPSLKQNSLQIDTLAAEGRPSAAKELMDGEEPPRISLPKSSQTPQQKSMERPANIEEAVNSRPHTNAATKNKELEDLARLIQAATGSVNNIVESSYQFRQTRQADRAARLKAQQQARSRPSQGEGATQSPPRQDPFAPAATIGQSQASLTQTNLGQIQSKIAEDDQNDHQILNNIDQIIQNLEKQQQDTQKLHSKFSSNRAFTTGTFPERQSFKANTQGSSQLQQQDVCSKLGHGSAMGGEGDALAETPTLPVLQEAPSSLEVNDGPHDRIQEVEEERETVATNQLNLERSGGHAASASISQTQVTLQQMERSNINRAETGENREFRETILLDENFEKNKIRLQQQVIRPVSNHSVMSTSTNRYGGNPGSGPATALKAHKKQEYEQFEDDDEEEGQDTGRAAASTSAAQAQERPRPDKTEQQE